MPRNPAEARDDDEDVQQPENIRSFLTARELQSREPAAKTRPAEEKTPAVAAASKKRPTAKHR